MDLKQFIEHCNATQCNYCGRIHTVNITVKRNYGSPVAFISFSEEACADYRNEVTEAAKPFVQAEAFPFPLP